MVLACNSGQLTHIVDPVLKNYLNVTNEGYPESLGLGILGVVSANVFNAEGGQR